MDSYGVHSPFDIESHKTTFINYCEVIIHPDGSIHYAVPSHQMYLEKYIIKESNWSELEFQEAIRTINWGNYLGWLLNTSNCIMVYTDGFMLPDKVTEQQSKSLQLLIDNDLVKPIEFH